MERFEPSLFDRLISAESNGMAAHRQAYSEAQVKDSVARDLESLLNTRCVVPVSLLSNFGATCRSVYAFGMPDFSCRSLSSDSDRQEISESIAGVIRLFEPRLIAPKVNLLPMNLYQQQRLEFSIEAMLTLSPFHEAVCFDAVLNPLTQRYVVSRTAIR